MDIAILIFFIVILIVGGGVLMLIARRSHGVTVLNMEKYRSDWLRIEQSVVPGNQSSYHMAIINGDKLLDQALRQRGFKGETMGERMKSAANTWRDANAVWTAHKLRNRIAHEQDVTIRQEDLQRALAAFRQGLKDMGAI